MPDIFDGDLQLNFLLIPLQVTSRYVVCSSLMKSFVDVKFINDSSAFIQARIVSIGLASDDCNGQSKVTIWFSLSTESAPMFQIIVFLLYRYFCH